MTSGRILQPWEQGDHGKRGEVQLHTTCVSSNSAGKTTAASEDNANVWWNASFTWDESRSRPSQGPVSASLLSQTKGTARQADAKNECVMVVVGLMEFAYEYLSVTAGCRNS